MKTTLAILMFSTASFGISLRSVKNTVWKHRTQIAVTVVVLGSSAFDAYSTNRWLSQKTPGKTYYEGNPLLRGVCGRNLACLDTAIQLDTVGSLETYWRTSHKRLGKYMILGTAAEHLSLGSYNMVRLR